MYRENKINANQFGTIIVNGYATPDISAKVLGQWAEDLTYISVYSYGFAMDGQLVPISDERLIEEADDAGVAPLMVLTPFDANGTYQYELLRELFTNPEMRDRLINNIVVAIMERDYFGIVFNFGFIAPEDKEQFVITVSKTAARLNRRARLVIVSLMPGINDEGIDYRSLGMASNSIELRTFSWSAMNDASDPFASIGSIRTMLDEITAMIDPNKILLGLPNFGDDWFDNSSSIQAKLRLIKEYGLAGVSIWTVMNPFPAAVEGINELYTVYKV